MLLHAMALPCPPFPARPWRPASPPPSICRSSDPLYLNTTCSCNAQKRFAASELGFDSTLPMPGLEEQAQPTKGVCPAMTWVLAALLCFGSLPRLNCSELGGVVDGMLGVGPVRAAGLLQMPPLVLNNQYYFVRSGESEFERMGVINTNPVTKTSIDSGLSPEGRKQAYKAALRLKDVGACEGSCWIWPSITQRSYQAAEIIAYVNDVDRSHIVPEYSFLDARGLGAYEGRDIDLLTEVHKTDSESPNIRPPPFTDGTPNESVADVFVRVTQLMSILETQYSGDAIIIVAPDSDNLSVLQAALIGLDLRRHNDLAFGPGEVRFLDIQNIPVPRPYVSGLIKCYKAPDCS